MYYKIRNDILFRQYKEYGYITDNSEYGYRFLNSNRKNPGENYVSESGAVMLAALRKSPRDINEIIAELMQIFQGVDFDTLKADTIEFYQWLFNQGYLSCGNTYESCVDADEVASTDDAGEENGIAVVSADECEKNVINSNDFLRSIHFDITSICNERCVHCYIPHKEKTKAIDSALFYRIIEDGRKQNIIHVTLSGGEPLLHPDFINFLARCRELDLSVNVLTNLTLLTDDMISEMKKNPLLSVQTSIYSMDAEVHDGITGVSGSLKKTTEGFEKLLSAGIPLQISCPIMKQNKDSFLGVIQWGKNHNVAVAIEPEIFASYDHSGSNLKNRLALEEFEAVVEKELSEGYAEVFWDSAKTKEALTENDPICSVCRYSFCVSVEGKVFPCAGWQAHIIGDLNQDTIAEIWENSSAIQELRKIRRREFAKCVTCEDRGYCTVCMMSNANENPDNDVFKINDFHCKVSAIVHKSVSEYRKMH